MCGPKPEKPDPLHKTLWDYGFYRALNTGKYEFLSFCDPLAVHWIAFFDKDLQRLLDGTIKQ